VPPTAAPCGSPFLTAPRCVRARRVVSGVSPPPAACPSKRSVLWLPPIERYKIHTHLCDDKTKIWLTCAPTGQGHPARCGRRGPAPALGDMRAELGLLARGPCRGPGGPWSAPYPLQCSDRGTVPLPPSKGDVYGCQLMNKINLSCPCAARLTLYDVKARASRALGTGRAPPAGTILEARAFSRYAPPARQPMHATAMVIRLTTFRRDPSPCAVWSPPPSATGRRRERAAAAVASRAVCAQLATRDPKIKHGRPKPSPPRCGLRLRFFQSPDSNAGARAARRHRTTPPRTPTAPTTGGASCS
jgi:hypothetical protein